MKRNIMFLLIGIILASSITAYATIKLQANEIKYNDTTLDKVLDDLYGKADSGIITQLDFDTGWHDDNTNTYSYNYNFSEVSGYESFTASNFLIVNNYSMLFNYTDPSVQGPSFTMTQSYNSTTGILTVTYTGNCNRVGMKFTGTIYVVR